MDRPRRSSVRFRKNTTIHVASSCKQMLPQISNNFPTELCLFVDPETGANHSQFAHFHPSDQFPREKISQVRPQQKASRDRCDFDLECL